MPWIYLIIAGLLEVAWAIGLKKSEGFSKLVPSVVTIVLMIISFLLLSLAMKHLPAGTSYAVWVGIGALGTVLVGAFWLGEPLGGVRIMCLVLLMAGIAGLKLTSE